jgi:hypothetical protein
MFATSAKKSEQIRITMMNVLLGPIIYPTILKCPRPIGFNFSTQRPQYQQRIGFEQFALVEFVRCVRSAYGLVKA